MKNSISIGPRFFLKERNNYSNHRAALIRELLQNATDSRGCSRIDIDLVEKDNSTIIKVKDTGSGMTEKVLKDVFLVMGETTKLDNSTKGGFGRARVLICFSQIAYTIKSFDYICEGCGGDYEIKKSKENIKGCIFEIETEKYDWISVIKDILNKSSLPFFSIFINGERYRNDLHRGKLVREMSFCRVYVNKSSNNHGVLVRVDGLWTFSKFSDIKAQVCVEINQEISREVLVSNRDGLQYNQDNELQAFLNELAADSRSGLRDKTKHFKKFVNKDKCFKSRPNVNNAATFTPPAPGQTTELNTVVKTIVGVSGGQNQNLTNVGLINPIKSELLPVYEADPILASMMVFSETDNPKMIQLIKNFYMPDRWTGKRTATRYQLIRIWFELVKIAIQELSNLTKEEYGFAVGWIFSDTEDDESAEAAHYYSEGVHYILLNPITINDLKLKYSVNLVDDYFSLAILATHEISHCVEAARHHNETFSSLFTELLKRVMNRRKEFVNNCKFAKDN